MKQIQFSLSKKELNELNQTYPESGQSNNIGKMAIDIVTRYFKKADPNIKFELGKNGADITVISKSKKETNYEVKGTEDPNIAFKKLKISSKQCHDALVKGMEIIRVTNIRQRKMNLYFLKHNVDFILDEEPRWKVIEKK